LHNLPVLFCVALFLDEHDVLFFAHAVASIGMHEIQFGSAFDKRRITGCSHARFCLFGDDENKLFCFFVHAVIWQDHSSGNFIPKKIVYSPGIIAACAWSG